jgi:hypothetical protein
MSMDLIVRLRPLDARDLIPAPLIRRPIDQAPTPALDRTDDPHGWFDGSDAPPPLIVEEVDEDAEQARKDAFRAKYHATDEDKWTHFTYRALGVLLAALQQAGALFAAEPDQHAGHPAEGDRAPRGPHGEVADYKLCSNSCWHVTREEAALLRDRLNAALDRSMVIEANGFRYDLRADSTDMDDRRTVEWLRRVAAFFDTAANHHGFEVW